MRCPPRFPLIAAALLCSTILLHGCATGAAKPAGTDVVDRVFYADTIRRKELQDTAKDILQRHDNSGVAIVVKYHLVAPFTASTDLARAQGAKIQKYLVKQGIKAPMVVSITPSSDPVNQIWISYQARRDKGSGVVFDQ